MSVKQSQDEKEITGMLDCVSRKVGGTFDSYLEIGSYAGESFLYVEKYLAPNARVVLVDLGDNKEANDHLVKILESLQDKYDIHLIHGDSTAPDTVSLVKDLCPESFFDLCLIDGNHDFHYVTSDLRTYGPLSSFIAMHDIDPRSILRNTEKHGYEKPCAAHVWQAVRICRMVDEFINPENEVPMGLGVLTGLSIGV